MDKNTGFFQFDNSGWPDSGDVWDALPETLIKFPFKFGFTNRDIEWLRTGHASTSFGFKWIYISDDKIYIHRGGRCIYQLKLNPDKLTHTAIHYFYDEVDELVDGGMPPMKTLLMILDMWFKDYTDTD